MSKKSNVFTSPIGLLILAGIAYWGLKDSSLLTPSSVKKEYLRKMDLAENVINSFSSQELNDVYTWVHDYVAQGRKQSAPADLRLRIEAISVKYNIMN